jgi:TatD DNase family protein
MIDFKTLGGDLDSVIALAMEQDVRQMLCVATTLEDIPEILTIAKNHMQIFASVGLHPNEIVALEPTVEQLVTLASSSARIIAIGETGLDYYRMQEQHYSQQQRFVNHIMAAKMCQKPLIVHTRQARKDTLAILRSEQAQEVGGVLHCFTEDWETAKKALENGFYISFSGIVTFKNAVELQEIAKKVPIDRLLIETDAPYLAPVPHRGKINQPAYVKYVAALIAQLRGTSFEEIACNTTQNFYNLFFKHKDPGPGFH